MKYSLILLLILVAVAGSFADDDAKPATRTAVVDVAAVVSRSSAGKELQKKLDAFMTVVRTRNQELEAKVQELRRLAGPESSKEKLAEIEKQIKNAMIAARRFRDDKQREGQKLQRQGFAEIEARLQPIIKAIVKERGIDVVLGQTPGVVVYASKRVDITAEMIKRLDAAK